MILNQTPIRTSKNYKINNIELDLEMPKTQEEFEGLTIFGDTSNFNISNSTSKQSLIYGNGKELENQIFENANQNIKIEETKTGQSHQAQTSRIYEVGHDKEFDVESRRERRSQ